MSLKRIAVIFGIVFVIVGVLGWVPAANPGGKLLGIFDVNAAHNVVHLATGVLAIIVGCTLVAAPLQTVLAFNALATGLYVLAFIYGIYLVQRSLAQPGMIRVGDALARALADADLPICTILVPAYREPEVIARVIRSLESLEYPRDRLDIKILLEEDDHVTIEAARRARPEPHIELLEIPLGLPRTKPRACNYALRFARGELVTIFDVEDRPDPLQIRRAVAAFQRVDRSVVCLQAKLSYYNARQNLITRWLTVEYASWFSMLLPALAAQGLPVPLGGTSMYLKRTVLEAIGGWDAFNVTEDADLGIRLHRMGYRTAVLDSTTYEEATSDFVNWVKQRSRWYKGYMQTWLVHSRHPRRLWQELGPTGFLSFHLTIGATPLVPLINPIFWLLTLLWTVGHFPFIETLFPPWLYYPGLLCMVFGNFMIIYANILGARMGGYPDLLGAVLLAPIYWIMMSIAALKALFQLIRVPNFWEKTTHGLDGQPSPEVSLAVD